MATARTADEVDAIWINTGVVFRVIHGVDDVLRGQIGSAGLGLVVNASEIWGDHHPAALLGQAHEHGALFDAARPGVQEDQQRHGGAGQILGRGLGLVVDDFLRRTVLGADHVDGHFERQCFHLIGGRSFCRFSRDEGHAGSQGGDGLHLAEVRSFALMKSISFGCFTSGAPG